MVVVKMEVAESMDEIARRKIDNLRQHHREQRVRCNVERDAEKQIGAALIELTTQLTVLHIKLKEDMTRRQRHLFNFGRVPRAHYQTAAIRIFFDLCDDVVDLIDSDTVLAATIPPLCAVNATEISFFISPFVPDRYAVFV